MKFEDTLRDNLDADDILRLQPTALMFDEFDDVDLSGPAAPGPVEMDIKLNETHPRSRGYVRRAQGFR